MCGDMGLLDYYMNPATQNLLGLASGLLSAGGPNPYPQSIGQGLARGLTTGAHLASEAGKQQYVGLQAKALQQTLAQKDLQNALAARFFGNGGSAQVAPPGATPAGMSPATSMSAFGTPAFANQAAPSQAAPQTFPFNPTEIAGLTLMGMPDLTGAYKASLPKVEVKDGIMYDGNSGNILRTIPTMNQQGVSSQLLQDPSAPGGFRVATTPGSLVAYGDQVRAGEQAKSESQPATVTIGGRPVQTTQAVANAITTGVAPDDRTAQMAAMTLMRNGALGTIRVGLGDGVVGGGNNSNSQSAQGNLPSGTNLSPSEQAGATAFSEAKAKQAAADSVKFRESWDSAQSTRGSLDLLEHLFKDPNVASGRLAEEISGLKGLAESFNVKIEGKSAEDVAIAISREMALKAKNQGGNNLMPGAMSNYEQGLLQSMSPSLAQSREGRLLLIQVFKAKAEKDARLAELAADYEDKHQKLDGGFYKQAREWSRANPLFTPDRIQAMTEYAKRLSSGR